MTTHATRRQVLIGTGLLAASAAAPAFAQDKPKLRFSAVFSEQDIRAEMMKTFAAATAEDFAFEGYYGGNLFKQGTELVALQRGNLEMGNIAPQDVSKQIPAWSILTAGYLFRDAAHLKAFFASDAGAEMKQMTEDQLGVKVLGPTYFGVRQVGLNLDKDVKTPADMAGVKISGAGPNLSWLDGTDAVGVQGSYVSFYNDIKTGVSDGLIGWITANAPAKIWEVAPYYNKVDFGAMYVGGLAVSQDRWDGFSDTTKEAFRVAAQA